MSKFKFLHQCADEIYYPNPSNQAIEIFWTGGPAKPDSQNVSLGLVDLGPTKNPDPYGKVVLKVAGAITQPSPGVGRCEWLVPPNFAFNPQHYYVFYIENAPAPVTNWVYSNPFKIVPESTVPAPGAGLGSNSNYFMYDNCTNLLGVSVTIRVCEDIIGSDGFGFQLNAYSAKGEYDAGQQYAIYLNPESKTPQLRWIVDNWANVSKRIAYAKDKLADLKSNILPAGYELKITLNNDSAGNVIGATYQATDNAGKLIGNHTIKLVSIAGVTAADLAPIIAFQLNFVNCINGGNTVLSSAAGTIVYAASNEMTAVNSYPACVGLAYSTGETANSVYGVLPAAPSQTFTQSFRANIGAAAIQKKGEYEHKLLEL